MINTETLYYGLFIHEWLGISFMSFMFTHLVWSIQKWLEREPKKDYTDFISRMHNGETLHSTNMFGENEERI